MSIFALRRDQGGNIQIPGPNPELSPGLDQVTSRGAPHGTGRETQGPSIVGPWKRTQALGLADMRLAQCEPWVLPRESRTRARQTDDACARAIFALIIINKAGGLVYNRTFADGLRRLTTNDYLVLAGTFHG